MIYKPQIETHTELQGNWTINDYKAAFLRFYEIDKSWWKVADRYGIHPNMARLIAKGHQPGNKIRAKLGLPPRSAVVSVNGKVPGGSITLGAHQCKCGQYFISNHPRRQKCFICSPYRGKPK